MLKFLPKPLSGGTSRRLVYLFGAMTLFFLLFDGIISYLFPLVVIEHGISKTLLGIILAAAAISGAFFDFAVYKIFKNSVYRRLFSAMFASAAIYIFIVWSADSFFLFLAAMAIWGFYYDLRNFGTLDFMGRYSEKKELASNFGTNQSFQALGCLLAPLIAGFLIIEEVGFEPFAAAVVFLSISALFFLLLLLEARGRRQHLPPHEQARKSFVQELEGWKKAGSAMLPLLALGAFATVIDSFFIALGPILAEAMPIEPFDGIFMFAYFLPPLLMGGLVGRLAARYGEKNAALGGLFAGSAALCSLFFASSPFAIIAAVFFTSCFTSLMLPSVQSAYASRMRSNPTQKKEIQELSDFAGNFGYVIGFVAAGAAADSLGSIAAFSAIGLVGVLFSVMLFFAMPKK